MTTELIAALLGGALGGLAIGFIVRHMMGKTTLVGAESRAKLVVDEAAAKAEQLTREADKKARNAAENIAGFICRAA